MYNTPAYIIYLSLVLAVVIFVGGFLFRNGKFFLEDIFHNPLIVNSVNRFLYAGYCLVNAGGAFRCLYKAGDLKTKTQAAEYISLNIGQLLILLALMHFFNMLVLPLLKNAFRSYTRPHP